MDCSLPDFFVHGISQERILEWITFPSPGDLPNPGIESVSPALADGFFTTSATWEAQTTSVKNFIYLTSVSPEDSSITGKL